MQGADSAGDGVAQTPPRAVNDDLDAWIDHYCREGWRVGNVGQVEAVLERPAAWIRLGCLCVIRKGAAQAIRISLQPDGTVTEARWEEKRESIGGALRDGGALREIPAWLGWIAILCYLAGVIGLAICCYWAYRRGRRDSMGKVSETEEAGFRFRIVANALLLLIPILNLYAAVHLATICYRHGLKRGPEEVSTDFTTIPGLLLPVAAIYSAMIALIVWVGAL
ncbi:MAG TPA: hypothetical protein VJL07_00655 [Dehalococcoidia bacterium]|nr:hypothetical protein [Dehalococcoidia bacterium]